MGDSQGDYEKELTNSLNRDGAYKVQLTKMNRRLDKYRITENSLSQAKALTGQLNLPTPISSSRAKLIELAKVFRSIQICDTR